MKVLDLFSGIGGFSLGFLSANYDNYDFTKMPNAQTSKSDDFFKIVAHCEIDPVARAVLSRRFNSPIFDDVCTLTAKDLPKIDVITSGFPCQDLSVAGKRAGINGSRSGLFSEILRIAYETNAKFILFENSAELIKNKQNFRVFASELRASGYGYRAFLFKACDFGYPHKRERAYIIAYSAQIGQLCDETLFAFLSDEYTQEPSKEIIPICSRYLWRRRNGYENDLRDIRDDDGFLAHLDRPGLLGNAVIPKIISGFARFIKYNFYLNY